MKGNPLEESHISTQVSTQVLWAAVIVKHVRCQLLLKRQSNTPVTVSLLQLLFIFLNLSPSSHQCPCLFLYMIPKVSWAQIVFKSHQKLKIEKKPILTCLTQKALTPPGEVVGWHHYPDGNAAIPFCFEKTLEKDDRDNQIPSDEREKLYPKSSTQNHSISALDNPQPDCYSHQIKQEGMRFRLH